MKADEGQLTTFDNIPSPIKQHIFHYLSPKELLSTAPRVSKKWLHETDQLRELNKLSNGHLWKCLLENASLTTTDVFKKFLDSTFKASSFDLTINKYFLMQHNSLLKVVEWDYKDDDAFQCRLNYFKVWDRMDLEKKLNALLTQATLFLHKGWFDKDTLRIPTEKVNPVIMQFLLECKQMESLFATLVFHRKLYELKSSNQPMEPMITQAIWLETLTREGLLVLDNYNGIIIERLLTAKNSQDSQMTKVANGLLAKLTKADWDDYKNRHENISKGNAHREEFQTERHCSLTS